MSGVVVHESSNPGLQTAFQHEQGLGPWSLPELGCRYSSALPCSAKHFFQLPGRGKEKDGAQSNLIKIKADSHSAHLSKY